MSKATLSVRHRFHMKEWLHRWRALRYINRVHGAAQEIPVIVIGPYVHRVVFHDDHYGKYLPGVLAPFWHIIIDTTRMRRRRLDLSKIRDAYFPDESPLVLFLNGPWLGYNGNCIYGGDRWLAVATAVAAQTRLVHEASLLP